MKRRILSIILIFTMLSNTTIVFAADGKSPNDLDNVRGLPPVVLAALKAAFNAAVWRVVRGIDNAVFLRDANAYIEGNSSCTNSGDVAFGNGSDEITSVTVSAEITTDGFLLDLFGQTNITNWLSEICIEIEDDNGDLLEGKYVGHNQHLFYYPEAEGTHKISYHAGDGEKWDCWAYVLAPDSRSNMIQSNLDENFIYNVENGKSYLIPSIQFISSMNTEFVAENNELDATELFNQFYDPSLKCSVNMLKDYSVGDKLIFSDNIDDILYNESKDITYLYFKVSNNESFKWPFDGNLMTRFSVGDHVKMEFTVEEEYSNHNYSFENLNYILDGYNGLDNGIYPSIDDYIIP